MDASRRRLAAIMFTDMVGYSALAQSDEAGALDVLEQHNQLLRPIFPRFHGHEVKTMGDAFLVEFESALDAVRCATEIQQLLHDRNATLPEDRRVRLRIGIHVGDVVETHGDVLGDAVNVASRIEPLAAPEGVCVTQQVVDHIRHKIDAAILPLPVARLKNIQTPTPVYRIVPPWETGSTGNGTAGAGEGHSLAVLPLTNISPNPGDGYFAEGLTEEIISTLSQVRELRVTARTSVNPYRQGTKSIAQVGAELGVDTILEGSVRKAGDRLRISLQLVDVANQRHIWSSSYNREIGDVFAVQTDIAERTAEALRVKLAPPDQSGLGRQPTENLEAYDLYLRALVAAAEPGDGGYERAVRCFEQATRLDPNFAEALAAWADLCVLVAGDYLPVREVMPRARELAARALELDPSSSTAHAALGNILLQFDHDWERSEAELRKASSLNPSNATALRTLGMLLIAQGRFDEAKATLRTAIRLDPASNIQATLAWAQYEAGDFEAAIRYGEEERERHPTSVARHVYLGLTYLAAGRAEAARKEAEAPLVDATDSERFDLALLNALVGRPETAREVIAEVERGEAKSYVSPAHLAMLYAAVGDRSRALDLLEKDYEEGDQMLWVFHRGVFFDTLRDDPRFVALLARFGLPHTRVARARPS